jgi:hypothetical protein
MAICINIYVKKWSEMITVQEINLNFLQEKLLIKQQLLMNNVATASINEIVAMKNSAEAPKEITVV